MLFISGKAKYLYGTFTGFINDEKGKRYEFRDIVGVLEETKFKW